MNLADKAVLYLISFAVFLLIDFVWLGWVAKDFYSTHLGELMADEVSWTSAIIFYLLFVAGLLTFVIIPRPGIVFFTPGHNSGCFLRSNSLRDLRPD